MDEVKMVRSMADDKRKDIPRKSIYNLTLALLLLLFYLFIIAVN
jgi:hypothetical protein